jgi:hypothetical protein
MNAVKGTNRLILDDMRLYLVIFTSIALGLTAVYVAIGFLFDVRYSSQLFGPMYGGICTFAIAGLVTLYPVAIGMGSTRIQFMKSFYMMGVCLRMAASHVVPTGDALLFPLPCASISMDGPDAWFSGIWLVRFPDGVLDQAGNA